MVSSILTRCSTSTEGSIQRQSVPVSKTGAPSNTREGVRLLNLPPYNLESTGMWIPAGLESRSPARVAVRLGYSPPVPEGAAHGGQLALSTRVRANGAVQFGRLPTTLFQVS